ncbi:MAG: thioredoxin family protein [Anaerolineaceae bacterium]|nr:MAG: thioredoxin family protein [Anaerolineaceae bacterium]
MANKPIVDGIEDEYRGRLTVIRINVQEAEFRPLLEQYNFQYTPTFILFDGGGEVFRSVGSINPDELRRALAEEP